ncbi:hypothetical protein VP01_1640g2 [Puccinia sorghi]|uniref:Uncharacterized protein n=1 Tax=Puccinia sorghi TaxID=27349 RepID=A0A0L6VIJ4_9BASI|nr:hypothetical protein VP01_1640g2 [Puccinia sorghi]
MAMQSLAEAAVKNQDLTGFDEITREYYQLGCQENMADVRARHKLNRRQHHNLLAHLM